MPANERVMHHVPEARQAPIEPVDFGLPVDELAQSLLGRQIVLLAGDDEGSQRIAAVQVVQVEPFGLSETTTHREIGKRYRKAFTSEGVDMPPGTVWAAPQQGGARQMLISALDDDQRGACVRVYRTQRVDLRTGEVFPAADRESEVAQQFRFAKNEILSLRVTENPHVLYLVRTGEAYDPDKVSRQEVSTTTEAFINQFFETEE